MSVDRVMFAFVIVLALTLNVGFVVGDIDNPAHHDAMELFLALVVSLIATALGLAQPYITKLLIDHALLARDMTAPQDDRLSGSRAPDRLPGCSLTPPSLRYLSMAHA